MSESVATAGFSRRSHDGILRHAGPEGRPRSWRHRLEVAGLSRVEEVEMAHASMFFSSPEIGVPSVALPKLRWPHPAPRTRALIMMVVMISPCFLSDAIGYGVMRLFLTADEIAAKQASDAILTQVRIFSVACPDTSMTMAEQERWAASAAQRGWPSYPEAGPGCFKPDRNLHGVLGLKAFSVACPVIALSAAGQRQWATFAADHDWAPYPQAGAGCVDP